MKKLNRYYKHSPLNKKLRQLYEIKQKINNCSTLGMDKRSIMNLIDDKINLCWRRSYNGYRGYEITVEMTNCRRNPDDSIPFSWTHRM